MSRAVEEKIQSHGLLIACSDSDKAQPREHEAFKHRLSETHVNLAFIFDDQ